MPVSLQSLARKAAFAPLVKACEARVAARQWTSAPIWSPEPLYFERNQYPRGRKLAAKPSKSKDCVQYSFDADGEVVRIRDWSGFLGKWSEEELFVPSGPGVVNCYRFHTDGRLMNIDRFTSEDGLLRLHEMYIARTKKVVSQVFTWKERRLLAVRVTGQRRSWRLEWDALGRLAAISHEDRGRSSEVFRRPPQGESLVNLLPLIRERLLELVPRLAQRARPKDPARWLALVVDEEEWRHLLPPSFVVGFDDDSALDAPELDYRDAALDAACERANQHFWKGGKYAAARKFVRALTSELRALDWEKLRKVTPDFRVFATSAEGSVGPA